MIERIELSCDRFILCRRILSMVAFGVTCLCLMLTFFGFVPLFGKSMNLIAAATGVFEVLNLGKGAFWSRVASVTFSVVYIVVAVKMITYIISALKHMKVWFFDRSDGKTTRDKAVFLRYYARKSVHMLLTLYVLSYVFSKFRMGVLSAMVLVILILLEFAINAAYQLVFSSDVKTGIINAANSSIVLIALLAFTFLSANVQVIDILKSIAGAGSALAIEGVGGEILLHMLLSQILMPLFNILMIVSLIRIHANRLDGCFDEQARATKILIRNIVFVCIMVIGLGYAHQLSVWEYFGLLYKNSAFILTSAVVYINLMNKTVYLEEVPYYTDSDGESDKETSRANESEAEASPAP